MTARLVPAMEPGSAEWFQFMTASKIAACMGLSTYESKFALWHRMAGLIPAEADNDIKRRGHYLEPAIRAWFRDQHPELEVSATGTWVSDDRPWQAASPDALAHHRCGCDLHRPGFGDDGRAHCCDPEDCGPCCEHCPTCLTLHNVPLAVAEFKSAHEDEDWGQPGTDDIPVGYRCQVMWQMDTLGVDTCYVAVLNRHLTFVEYVVRYDETEAKLLRKVAEEFMDSLAREERPDIDAHSQTYLAVRQLNPDIEDRKVEVDGDLARDFCTARHTVTHAEAEVSRTTSAIAAAMGNAKHATFMGQTIARRQTKRGGVPYVVEARNLPTFGDDQ